MDSELSGLRSFLISINSKLISNQKEANQILEVTKKREHHYDSRLWCAYVLSAVQSYHSLSKENPVKLTETSAELITPQELVLAVQYSSVKYNRIWRVLDFSQTQVALIDAKVSLSTKYQVSSSLSNKLPRLAK